MNKTQKLKIIGIVCILSFALVFIGLNFLQAEENGKSKPPDKGKPEPPSPLVLNPADIVTAESNAVRVWDCSIDAYDAGNPVWSTKTPGHFSVGVGNVDDDDFLEIVVPEIKGTPRRGKKGPDNFKFFLNIYKEGGSGIWHSTEDYAYLTNDVRHAQVIVADVDGEPGDEVVLLTYENLAIFKYAEGGSGDELFTMTQKTVEDFNVYHFIAVTAGNVNRIEADGDEIIVSAFDSADDREYVFILNEFLNEIDKITDDLLLDTYSYSLCAADLDGDGVDEICATGSIYCGSDDGGVLWQAKVFVWHWSENYWECFSLLIPGWETGPVNMYPYLCLDVGELNRAPGIVVSANSGYQDYYLYLYNYNDVNKLFLSYPSDGDFGLFLPDADHVYDVEVGDVDGDTSNNEIVVAGTANVVTCFYLEVFGSNFNSLWKRIGEHRKEGRVFDTVIVK